jgi:hypothetical protein
MNFREQLSEAYKTGYNQGLQELYAGAHEGAHEEEEGYHEGMHEMDHEEDEGYHEEMDEKALAELGRMMIRAGMHEMDHEEDEGYHEGMHEGEHDEIEELAHDVGVDPFLGIDELDNYAQILRNRKAFGDIFNIPNPNKGLPPAPPVALPPIRRGG